MSPEDYARWAAQYAADQARAAAEFLRTPPANRTSIVPTDADLAALLDNLAAIAEREAGRES